MSVQVYYFIMKVSDYHNFPFYIAVICCSLRMRLCVYRLRVTELGGRVYVMAWQTTYSRTLPDRHKAKYLTCKERD